MGLTATGVLGSVGSSRTRELVELVLGGAAAGGATVGELVDLGSVDVPPADATRADERTGAIRGALDALEASDVVVFGTPIYRATYSGLLKSFLDLVPRGGYDGSTAPLRAKPVAVVATAATAKHFLGLQDLEAILHGFFAAHVVPPGIFAAREDFTDAGVRPEIADAARSVGRALVDLHAAVAASPALRDVQPHV